jgi:hypothetical protein
MRNLRIATVLFLTLLITSCTVVDDISDLAGVNIGCNAKMTKISTKMGNITLDASRYGWTTARLNEIEKLNNEMESLSRKCK